MDKRKLLYELSERTADPIQSQQCMRLIESIEDERSRMGKTIMELLTAAENGDFK